MTPERRAQPDRVTITEAAARLGVSRWTVRRMMDDGELDAIHVRGALRIDAASIERYVSAHLVDGKLEEAVAEAREEEES